MTGKSCKRGKRGRKHTPITSKRQRGKFGKEYAMRKKGMKGVMPGITAEELRSHLKESKGKNLPKKVKE